jgi:iron complex outermembrane receptor protein
MKRTPLAVAISLALVPVFASAQMLEEVIVTAQKKAENLTEAPVAVSFIGGKELTNFNILQADGLNKLVSGLEVRFEGDSRVGVGVRGVGTFQQQSAPARVGVYMDDFYMSSQAAFALGSMWDMATVQMLKGPQGTLYGQPSPTGALILKTRDPDFDGVSGYVQGTYLADPEGYNIQGAVNVPLVKDQLAMRVAILTDDRETGTENINPINSLDEERNRDAIRAKLLWQPTDSFEAKLGYSYAESKDSEIYRILETVPDGQPGDGLDDYEANGFPEYSKIQGLTADDRYSISDAPSEVGLREQSLWTLHLNGEVGDIDIAWFTGFIDSETAISQDNDRTDIPAVILGQTGHVGDDWGASQHELRVSGAVGDAWDWTVGAYYQETESRTDVITPANRPSNGGVFNIIIGIPLESEVKALFTHNTIHLSEDTDLTIGVRYNEFDQSDGTTLTGDFLLGAVMHPGGEVEGGILLENVFPQTGCADGTAPPCLVGAGDFGWEEWTGTVKLSHHFSDAANAYVTLDRGFRPGAPNFDTSGVFSPDLTFYEGESVDSIEFGLKGDVMDGRGRYTAAAFYSLYEDYQAQAIGVEMYNTATGANELPTNAPFVNVDEAVQKGIEADFRMQVTDALMIYTGFTYAEVEFTAGVIPCTDPTQAPVGPDNRYNTCEADGGVGSPQPELTAVFQSEYVFSDSFMGGESYVSGLWKFNGETKAPGDPTERLSTASYSIIDLFAGVRSQEWTAQVFVKNVFDDDGIVAKRALAYGYNEVIVTPPRTVGVTASYHFN